MNKSKWKTETSPSRLYIKLAEEFGEVTHEWSDAIECVSNGEREKAIGHLDKMSKELDQLTFIAEQLQLRVRQTAVRYGLEEVHAGD